jgi:hypothetical protein
VSLLIEHRLTVRYKEISITCRSLVIAAIWSLSAGTHRPDVLVVSMLKIRRGACPAESTTSTSMSGGDGRQMYVVKADRIFLGEKNKQAREICHSELTKTTLKILTEQQSRAKQLPLCRFKRFNRATYKKAYYCYLLGISEGSNLSSHAIIQHTT